MTNLVVGLLCGSRLKTAPSPESARQAVARASELLNRSVAVELIHAEDLDEIPQVDLLIHALGNCYPEEGWGLICDYFRRGGHLMSLGCRPFSVPVVFMPDGVQLGPPTDAALHALRMADTFMNTGPFDRPDPQDVSPRFDFLAGLRLPALAATGSLDVRLAPRTQEDEPRYARHGVREAELDVACRLCDAAGRPIAAPIARINHDRGGRLTFLNFEPADAGFYDSAPGCEFLGQVIAASLREGWSLSIRSRFARYYPHEDVRLTVRARRLSGDDGQAQRRVVLTVREADDPAGKVLRRRCVPLSSLCAEHTWDGLSLPEGCYTVRARLEVAGRCLEERQTGLYVLSDERAQSIAARAPRLEIDPAIAPDYCVADGRPFPMTGSTFMAPDNFRDCFGDLNVAVARREMDRLRKMGVNILRAGVWTSYGLIYEKHGGFTEKALRSIDAYFLSAAQAGLPVQFVPSAFVMNCWNREASMFHDPMVRARVMQCFRQFARRYAGWPGVQLDIINEPSYGPFKHGCMWQRARPIGDPHELTAWHVWLRKRYHDDLAALRAAWGVSSAELPSFEDPGLPEEDEFVTGYDGPPRYTLRTRLADFYAFADDTFTEWVREIRQIVRAHNPAMLLMIGRDETLRVPTQQRDAFEGNIDVVNWHQWHREGAIFNEYCLNRVPGRPCCGQEMGVLAYKDQRNDDRLSELQLRDQLERKLVYCLGNWIQWQSHSDPVMDSHVENKLGMLRADGTERPAAGVVRLLSWLEAAMADRLVHRREDRERLAIVVPTSLWFSSDTHLAYQAVTRAIVATHYHLKRPAYMILENLIREDNRAQIGRPAVVILPSPTIISTAAWQFLLAMVRHEGLTLLLTGSPQQDEYWRRCDRLAEAGIHADVANLATVERLSLGEQIYDCTFHEALRLNVPGKALLRAVPGNAPVIEPVERPLGAGRIVYCPLPVELCDSVRPVVELYRRVLDEAADLPPALVEIEPRHNSAAHFIYAVEYRDCTMVSLVNEGTDARFSFTLSNCDCDIELDMAAGRGAKLYVDSQGRLLAGYIHGRLKVGTDEVLPHGDLSFIVGPTPPSAAPSVDAGEGWQFRAGQRSSPTARINGQDVHVTACVPCAT